MFMALKKCHDIAQYFKRQLSKKKFCVDRSGHRTIELVGACFEADRPAIFGKPNDTYIQQETAWYDSQICNINAMDPVPEQWRLTANASGDINSNYGALIYSEDYDNQYEHCLNELRLNPESRRATMIYTRPSIWHEYNESGKNDFICTNAVTYYCRDSQLHAVVQMRSNDVVYGYKNDRAWQSIVLSRLADDLGMMSGRIIWQVQNLHVYARHFKLIS